MFVTRVYREPQHHCVYRIADNVGQCNSMELLGANYENIDTVLPMTQVFFLGQPNKHVNVVSPADTFFVKILHHVEERFWSTFSCYNGIMFPVKFYVEGVSSFISESGYFFSTITNVYGTSIRNTREA